MADDDDGLKTQATRLATLPPVDREDQLPMDAEEGAMCFVRELETSFIFVDGAWASAQGVQP